MVQQRLDGNTSIVGVMLESNLKPGNQPPPAPGDTPQYGLSITDPCLGWEATEDILRYAHERLASVTA